MQKSLAFEFSLRLRNPSSWVGEQTAKQESSAKRVKQQNECGPGPATPGRIVRLELSSCLPAARSGEPTVPVRQRPLGVPLLPVLLRNRDSKHRSSATETAASGPTRSRSEKWRRPQCPGNRHALARISDFPCHQRHRNRRLASVESSNVFAGTTLRETAAPRNRKTFQSCEQAVEDETSLWKAEENAAGNSFGRILRP
jgi:hypothetical protein